MRTTSAPRRDTRSASGIPIVVAVHSTARGPAIGGCRIKPYRSVGDGVADALRLSRAMTLKCGLCACR
ncbi:Glu/Leu/Phe/Val dehydrogenase dimerization domain-containing protein [Nonomuraea glycinis]|uniref:Glu/Leu/Phe/Val dehydrogenase dimerization domain-containing protein n=1 Tax=Nonomuraea glycinis TaxID=2047744 RepID=UPI002E0DB16C|nr:hypothetical protein OHA68_00945 [Nonomuraea glycinis]